MAGKQSKSPAVGEEGFIQEPHTLSVVLKCLPREVRGGGSRRQTVVYSCLDVSGQYLAMGSEQGYVWLLDLHATKLIRELSDFRGTAVTAVALSARQGHIAFGTQDGQTKIDSFTKQMSKGYRIQEKDRQTVVAMTWDHTGTTLLCAYSSGKLIKASFQFAGEVMEVVPLLECGSSVVQLSLCDQSLLISTLARSLLLDMESGRVTQVGTKERKSGSFGGCLSLCSPPDGAEGEAPVIVAHLARPGLRMWTADNTGKVTLTTKFRGPLSSGQFPHVPTHNWSPGGGSSCPQFSESWQFSLVLPWLGGLVVTHHDHTLWVLDPATSTVAGVLYLEHTITSVAIGGKFVYVLCDGLSRPLARFAAHSSYLKSLQRTTGGSSKAGGVGKTGEEEEDLTSLGSVAEVRESAESPVWYRGSEELEKLKPTNTTPCERDTLSAPASVTTHSEEEPTLASDGDPNKSNSITDSQGTTGAQVASQEPQTVTASEDTLTAEVEGEGLSQDKHPRAAVLQGSHTTDGEAGTDKMESLADSIDSEHTPLLLVADILDQQADSQVSDQQTHTNADPETEVPPLTDTQTTTAQHTTGPVDRQQYTDPPSVTGPTGMQDLAREVTDLLWPALGKLSTLMRPQERRRDGGSNTNGGSALRTGQTSRTASPCESPLVERAVGEGEGEGEEEGGGVPGEGITAAGPSPRLILKLGGKLGELISGERDKERDSPFSPASGTQSVGVTPAAIGPEEEQRRLRMSQVTGEEDAVSERLTQRKRRKRRTKKHSSKPSSTSSSLERLTDIGGDGEASLASSPQVEPVSDTNEVSVGLGEVVSEGGDERSIETRKLSALAEKEELVSSLQTKAEQVNTTNANIETRSQDHDNTTTLAVGLRNPPDLLDQETTLYKLDKAVESPGSIESRATRPGTISLSNRPSLAHTTPFDSTANTAELSLGIPEINTDTSETFYTGREVEERGETNSGGSGRDEVGFPGETVVGPLSPGAASNRSQFLASEEVTLGSDPLSQIDDSDSFFKPRSPASRASPHRSPRKTGGGGRQSERVDSPRQLASGDEVPLELSDNPLYGEDTSDFTTDTESSQQRSRRGSSAKPLQSSSRGSSVVPTTYSSSSSAAFAAKHMRTKGGPSLGVSQAVSDLSWDGSLQVPRPRSDRLFTPSASPFEVSNSPVDLSSSSYHSTSSNTLQVPATKAPASLPLQSASLPSPSTLLLFQENTRRPPGEESGSDFSADENEPEQPEQFSLCAAAVEERRPSPMDPGVSTIESPSPLSPRVPRHLPFDTYHSSSDRDQQEEEEDSATGAAASARESSPDPDADIWVTVPHPCRGHVQSICLSDHLLWLVDSRGMVYCTEINTKGKRWELIKHQMQQISSSPSGSVVWGMYRHNVYVRQGVRELNKLGNVWMNMTKGTSLAQKIKCVCADEEGVWAVKNDGQIIFRKGVSCRTPQGRVWVEVGRAAGFTSVTACSGVVWATNASGRLFYREGVTEQNPSGRKWVEMKAPPLEAVCMTQGNIAWIIDGEGKMGFRCGVSRGQPTGKNPWWEVTVSTTLLHSSLPFNSLWQVMTSEGSQFLSSVSSLIHTHLPGHHKLLAVSASNKSGVCVLESGSKLHACWRSTSGYHYSSASKDGVFQLTTWTRFGSGSTGLWVVRDDGELYCVTPQDKFIRIECADTVQNMAVSSTALWVMANNQLWSRQGMTTAVPEGISWDYIELSPQLHQRKLKHIVCGKRAVWAVDGTGVPHFRFGVHAREPGTGMSPAWVPVDDLSHPIQQITVSNNDWLVWAVDENCNSYVRTGVTPDFPVGTAWEVVPEQPVKQLCAHGRKLYALTPSGNLLCRYGITETNFKGNYWRQLPGNFSQISVGHGGVLLGLDSKGSILRQQCKTLTVSQDSEFLMHGFEGAVDNSWEVV